MAGVEPRALMTKEMVTMMKLVGASMPIAPPTTARAAPARMALDLLPRMLARGRAMTMPMAVGMAPMMARVPWS